MGQFFGRGKGHALHFVVAEPVAPDQFADVVDRIEALPARGVSLAVLLKIDIDTHFPGVARDERHLKGR